MRKESNNLTRTISLLSGIVLITSAPPGTVLSLLGVFTTAFSLMVSAYLLTERRRQFLLATLLGTSAFLPYAWAMIYPKDLSLGLANGVFGLNLGFWLLFTIYIGVIVFRSIINARRIRSNEIYGTIYVYLLIGVLFAEVYQMLLIWQPDAFYFDPSRFAATANGLNGRDAGDVLYYSFVTLTTVGYGDVTPSSRIARSLSLIETVTGTMYVATMISRMVSIQISDEKRGEEPESADN